MRCEKIKPILNDFFNKSLSPGEERQLEGHLAACELCRAEFQKLKRADDILREVVLEMVSGIEVPPDLNHKIKSILKEKRHKTLPYHGLSTLLRTPAVAAAMLFLVLGAGIFGYYNFINQAAKQQVVMNETLSDREENSGQEKVIAVQDAPVADGTSAPAPVETIPVVVEENVVENGSWKPGTAFSERRPNPMLAQSARSKEVFSVKETLAVNTVDDPAEQSGPQPPEAAALNKVPEGMDGETPVPVGKGAITALDVAPLRKGTLDEAARDTGFVPVRPGYLPPGAQLLEVSWRPEAITRSYRTGNASFTLTQSRADLSDPGYEQLTGQGAVIELSGVKAYWEEAGPLADGSASGRYAALRWQRGTWAFAVAGDLPRDEIIKIATGLN